MTSPNSSTSPDALSAGDEMADAETIMFHERREAREISLRFLSQHTARTTTSATRP